MKFSLLIIPWFSPVLLIVIIAVVLYDEMQLHRVFAASAVASLAGVAGSKVIDLSGNAWTLENKELNISVPGSVPSYAHIDLYEASVIGDPLYALNEFNLRWVVWANWTYVSDEIRDLDLSENTTTYLLFNGLDIFTSISFCDQHVAATNNQFRQYSFDVSSILSNCSGPPHLSINFGSAPKIANEVAAIPGQETWPEEPQQVYEFTNRWFVRKEQSDFGWDWGPALAPAGLWQPAWVVQLNEQSSEVYVKNAAFDIYREGQLNNLIPDQNAKWILNASIDILGALPENSAMVYRIVDSVTNKTVDTGNLVNITNGGDVIWGIVTLDPASFDLWWPAGMGPQKLYNITINIMRADDSSRAIATAERRMGFRTIVLNNEKITEEEIAQGIAPGSHWHFEINGHPFYAKGSNFIPPDVLWPRVTPDRIRTLFDSAISGNQNMLRVWSSGAYSPDFMYDLADEMGLLLWSEFQFGCALYPVAPEFLDNVRQEAVYQVRRVNHHPSLALWAGGNEMENLELGNYIRNMYPDMLERYMAEYETLFLGVLLPAVYGNSKSIGYMPSSTNNGWLSLDHSAQKPMVLRYWNVSEGEVHGDTDYYHYLANDAFNLTWYPVGRFANEFGYHSMPGLATWRGAVPDDDLYFNSSSTTLRNHHYVPGGLNTSNFNASLQGNFEMTWASQLYYPAVSKLDPLANFSAWCHTTQLFQADYYKSQIQFYRVGSGLPQRQLGSLYWQLEDQWEAPTWASIDYHGRWKVLHYVAKDIYQNIIITPFYNDTTRILKVYAVSDLWEEATGQFEIQWLDWSGKPLALTNGTHTGDFMVGPLNITLLATYDVSSIDSIDLANAVMLANITAIRPYHNSTSQSNHSYPTSTNQSSTTTTFTHRNFFTPTPLSKAKLVDPELSVEYDEGLDEFVVRAKGGVSIWTWLEVEETWDGSSAVVVIFDDNAFTMTPGEERRLGYKVIKQGETEEWKGKVIAKSGPWDNGVE